MKIEILQEGFKLIIFCFSDMCSVSVLSSYKDDYVQGSDVNKLINKPIPSITWLST